MPLLLVAWLFLASAVSMLTGCGSDSSPSFPPNTNVTTGGTSTTGTTTTTTGVQQQVPVKLAFVTQPGAHALNKAATSPGQATEALPPFEVAIEDASGNVVTTATGIPVTISLGSGANNAKLSGTLTVNSVNGIATFNNVIVSFAGTFTLVASSPGLQSSTSASFTVQPLALSFPTHENFPNEGLGSAVAFGDFNGDGIQDVAVFSYQAYSTSNSIRTMLGNGDGTFKPAVVTTVPLVGVPHQTGHIPNNTVAAADLNGDKRTDLVFSSVSSSGGAVLVALANSDGTFNVLNTSLTTFNAPGAGSVAVGKLSGDTNPGVDVAFSYYSSVSKTNKVFFGTLTISGTTPTFVANSSANFNAPVDAIVAGDFNGDSKLDFATIYVDSSNSIAYASVYSGNGQGKFTGTNYTALTGIPTAVGAGFIDGDTKEDLLIGEYSSSGFLVETLLGAVSNGGAATLTLKSSGLTPLRPVTGIVVAPFGGDTSADAALTQDLTVANSLSTPNLTASGKSPLIAIETVKGNGDGTFGQSSAQTSSVAAGSSALRATDLNGDGVNDLLAVNVEGETSYPLEGTAQVLLGKAGSIALTAPPAALTVQDAGIRTAIADVNGDGAPDVITLGFKQGPNPGGAISVLLNGNGPAVSATLPKAYVGFAVADLNGDGRADVALGSLTQTNTGSVDILLGQTDGTFKQGATILTGNVDLSVTLADLNGDGKTDLVASSFYSGNSVITVALGNGDGTFQSATNVPTGLVGNPGILAQMLVADVNGDNRPDVLVLGANGTSQYLETFLNNGNGGFSTTPSHNQTVSGAIGNFSALLPTIAAADFDHDGKTDLAILTANQGGVNGRLVSVNILKGNGDGSFQAAGTSVASVDPTCTLRVADVNADGVPDLLVVEALNDDVVVLTGNGDGTFATGVGFGVNSFEPIDVAVADVNGDGRPDIVTVEAANSASGTNNLNLTGGVTILLHNQ
jgi:hypothetical protein